MGNVNVQPCRCREEQDEYDVDGDVFGNATVSLGPHSGSFLILSLLQKDFQWSTFHINNKGFVSSKYPGQGFTEKNTATQVFLNIYDLNEEWLQSNHISKDVLNIGGAFHAGVEVHGKEWYFGQEGIECQEPRQHEVHVYRSSIPMGNTCYPEHEVQRFMLKVMSKQWLGGDYDMLERNCCSFAEALCQYLVGRAVPNWVTRFPRMASSARRGMKDLVHAAESLANERLNQKFLDGDSNVFFLCIWVGFIMLCIEFRTRMTPLS